MKPAPALAVPVGCTLLENIPSAALQQILSAATRRRLVARQVLLHAGDPANLFFVLLSGRACTYTYTEEGQRVIVSYMEPGQVVGAAALLPRSHHYLLNTEIVEEGEALEWKREVIRDFFHRIPSLADNVLMLAAELIQLSIAGRMALLSQSAEQRIACLLAELAETVGRPSPRGIEVAVTNEQIADCTSVTPFTVARILSAWNRSGAIHRNRGKIEVRSLEKLLAPAERAR